MEKVNLGEAFASFDEPWSPRLAGELNGQAVKLARAKGEFVRHSHETPTNCFSCGRANSASSSAMSRT